MLKLNPCIITGAFLNPELVVQKVFCNMPVSKENGKRLGGGGGGGVVEVGGREYESIY